MFSNLLVIAISLPLHVFWIIQVARLLGENRKGEPGRLPPILPLLGTAARI
jgi:hypothetical protein